MQPWRRGEEFPELPLGAETDFRTTILREHPELGSPRIDLQCRRLIRERDKLSRRVG